jgi:hypothetical protein
VDREAMKLNIQIDIDIKEFGNDDKKLHVVLWKIADEALETTADKDITDIVLEKADSFWIIRLNG